MAPGAWPKPMAPGPRSANRSARSAIRQVRDPIREPIHQVREPIHQVRDPIHQVREPRPGSPAYRVKSPGPVAQGRDSRASARRTCCRGLEPCFSQMFTSFFQRALTVLYKRVISHITGVFLRKCSTWNILELRVKSYKVPYEKSRKSCGRGKKVKA